MTVATELALAIVLGSILATGVLLAATRLPRWSAPSLARRIAPYVRDLADPAGLTPMSAPVGSVRLAGRWVRLLSLIGGAELVSARLAQAGWSGTVEDFRGRQLAWATCGVVLGGAIAVAAVIWSGVTAATPTLPPLLGVAGAAWCELRLSHAARRRRSRIEDELPTVLEFLSLCLAAGEGLRDALRRVGHVGTGELTAELRRVVLDTGTGSSLADALASVGRRLDVPALSRAIEHIVAAIDRGAPLARVLQDQALDAREDAKRTLIEIAGRKEIAMLLPLVFLLLPLSVLFAVFPGIVMLRLGVG
jgi:tight adherence protein C